MAIYSEFSHETWWFSIVMLVYQRVTSSTIIPLFLHHIQPLGPMDLARASRSGTTPSGRATSWGRCWENWRSTWSWAWKIYGFMMVYDGLWWFMMVYDGLWWFMMVYDGLWWFMMVYDGLWWFMMVYDGLWWFMAARKWDRKWKNLYGILLKWKCGLCPPT